MFRSGNSSSPRGLGTAVRTLTIIPWPGRESDDFAASLAWFPLVGLALGLILYGIGFILNLLPVTRWPAGIALLMVVADICLTRGLHLDGLADWADSIGGFLEREKRLSIMKDTSLGTFGVLALIVALLARWIAFERLISSGSIIWILAIYVFSRDMMVELITTLPYARAGEGMGRPFVAQASNRQRVLSHAATIGICLPFGPFFIMLLCVGWIETRLFSIRIKKQFGGITGDLLGTANQMVEVTLLIICSFLAKSALSYTGWAWIL